MILSQAIIADVVPARERAKYMGPIGALFGLSAVAGPLVGGFFTDHASLGWQWCFWINVPVGLAALAIGWFTLTLPRKRSTTPLDSAGIVALSATTTSLILFTDFGGSDGWGSWQALSLLAAFVVSACVFVAVERRAVEPIIPLSLFGNRTFVVATALGAAVGLGMFSAIAFMPTFLQMSSGLSAANSGLLMLPMVAGIILIIQGSAGFIQKTGRYKGLHGGRRPGDHRRDGVDDDPVRAHLAVDGRRDVLPARRRARPHHAERRAGGAERRRRRPDRHRHLHQQLLPRGGCHAGRGGLRNGVHQPSGRQPRHRSDGQRAAGRAGGHHLSGHPRAGDGGGGRRSTADGDRGRLRQLAGADVLVPGAHPRGRVPSRAPPRGDPAVGRRGHGRPRRGGGIGERPRGSGGRRIDGASGRRGPHRSGRRPSLGRPAVVALIDACPGPSPVVRERA